MRIREVGDYLTAISPFIEKERTCDGWLFGDPDRELAAMAVAWMGTIAVIEEAGGEKVNLLVVHEPLFYGDKTPDKAIPSTSKPVNLGRRKLLEEYGIVVYRCHDGWDTYPEIGVVDSWAAALGLGAGGNLGLGVLEFRGGGDGQTAHHRADQRADQHLTHRRGHGDSPLHRCVSKVSGATTDRALGLAPRRRPFLTV